VCEEREQAAALVGDRVAVLPKGPERNKAFGVWSAIAGTAGAVIGDPVIDGPGVAVVVAVLSLLAAVTLRGRKRTTHPGRP